MKTVTLSFYCRFSQILQPRHDDETIWSRLSTCQPLSTAQACICIIALFLFLFQAVSWESVRVCVCVCLLLHVHVCAVLH